MSPKIYLKCLPFSIKTDVLKRENRSFRPNHLLCLSVFRIFGYRSKLINKRLMRDQSPYQLNQAPRITIQNLLSKGIITLFFLVAVIGFSFGQASDTAQEYVFSSTEDNLYENPANWSPAYPGTVIPRNAVVFIEGTAFLTGYDLEIHGTVRVSIGSGLQTSTGKIVVAAGGKLTNDGEIISEKVENYGVVNNNLSAYFNVNGYVSYEASVTNNLMAAEFVIGGNAVNGGTFNNYSVCKVHNEFSNRATFNELSTSELLVKGAKVTFVSRMSPQEISYTLDR